MVQKVAGKGSGDKISGVQAAIKRDQANPMSINRPESNTYKTQETEEENSE